MPIPILVVVSDCHLQPYNWVKYPDLRGDAFYSFRQIVDYCISRTLPLFMAGDVLHKRLPDSETMNFVCIQLERLQKLKIPVYHIQGQHEMADPPWLSCSPWADHVHRDTVEISGIKFYGLDYTPVDKLQKELKAIPKEVSVLVGHQVWSERMGSQCNPEASMFDTPDHINVVISGDFHGHRVDIFKNDEGRAIKAVSPGSIYLKSTDEDNRKFFFLMYDNYVFESIQLETRPVIRHKIRTKLELEQAINDVHKSTGALKVSNDVIKTPIWCVEYSDELYDIHARLCSAADKYKLHLFDRPIKTKKDESAIAVSASKHTNSLETYLPHKAKPGTLTYKTAARLLKSNDPKQELNTIVSEVIKEEEAIEKKGIWSG